MILNTMNNDSQTLRWDISKGNPEDNLDFIKQVEMDLSNESVEERQGNQRIKHSLSWIATVDLDGTVVSLHDQSIARAVDKMQAFPPHLLDEQCENWEISCRTIRLGT